MTPDACAYGPCLRTVDKVGLCLGHYWQRRRRTPLRPLRPMGLAPARRFWSKVDTSRGPDACWPWTASVFAERGGYGKFQAGTSRATKRVVYAHRYVVEMATETPLGRSDVVMHACDNPPCCNPAHLSVGTHADNSADMARKHRSPGRQRDFCQRGHRFTPENTGWQKGGRFRFCIACDAANRESQRKAA